MTIRPTIAQYTLNTHLLKCLIFLTLLINSLLILIAILPDHDPTLYASIAKQMVLTKNWVNLMYNHLDWLDKPHFPFWVTAFSFKVGGISSFSYIFPGFIFHLIGAYYTYLLARHLFNQQTGLLAVLFYVTATHLMQSSIDVKAEAYLLGEIMPACYYWLLYYEHSKIKLKYLFLGALFTACAIMTKGIFVLVTITGGLIALWLNNLFKNGFKILSYKEIANYFIRWKFKWVLAFILSSVFIAPELLSLYFQFDAHPEKTVFAHTHVSGIKWFFWDSQVGRFFNTGPITKTSDPFHYVFFIHTFLWSFLPWSFLFIAALFQIIKSFFSDLDSQQRNAYVFLLGSFFPTFIMFSVSSFQLDHYTNIIIPFAAIMCAHWLDACIQHSSYQKKILRTQVIVAILLTFTLLTLNFLFFGHLPIITLILIIGTLLFFIVFSKQSTLFKSIVYPTLAINLVFIVHMLINRDIYTQYDAGYKIANYLNQNPSQPIFGYEVGHEITLASLFFHSKAPFSITQHLHDLPSQLNPYYLVIPCKNLQKIENDLGLYPVVFQTTGISFLTKPFKVISSSLSKAGITPNLRNYCLLHIDNSLKIGHH